MFHQPTKRPSLDLDALSGGGVLKWLSTLRFAEINERLTYLSVCHLPLTPWAVLGIFLTGEYFILIFTNSCVDKLQFCTVSLLRESLCTVWLFLFQRVSVMSVQYVT